MAAEVVVGGVAEGQDGVARAVQARGCRRGQGVPEPGAVVGGVAVAEGAGDQQQVGVGRAGRSGSASSMPTSGARCPAAASRSAAAAGELLGVAGLRGPQHDDLTARRAAAGVRRCRAGSAAAREYMPASTPLTHRACSGANGRVRRQHGHAAARRSRDPGEEADQVLAFLRRSSTGGGVGVEPEGRQRGAPGGHGGPARSRVRARRRAAAVRAPGRGPATGVGDLRQRHRAHLELRLEGQRVDGVAGHRVDAQVLAEQVVPVERREAAPGPHPVRHHGGQHGPAAPRRDLHRSRPSAIAQPRGVLADAARRTARG